MVRSPLRAHGAAVRRRLALSRKQRQAMRIASAADSGTSFETPSARGDIGVTVTPTKGGKPGTPGPF
jgi:hypothetical protein